MAPTRQFDSWEAEIRKRSTDSRRVRQTSSVLTDILNHLVTVADYVR